MLHNAICQWCSRTNWQNDHLLAKKHVKLVKKLVAHFDFGISIFDEHNFRFDSIVLKGIWKLPCTFYCDCHRLRRPFVVVVFCSNNNAIRWIYSVENKRFWFNYMIKNINSFFLFFVECKNCAHFNCIPFPFVCARARPIAIKERTACLRFHVNSDDLFPHTENNYQLERSCNFHFIIVVFIVADAFCWCSLKLWNGDNRSRRNIVRAKMT